MYYQTNDQELFKRFWQDEKENSPRYFNDSGNTWHCSETDFLDFCSRMWRIYCVDETALVYIESSGEVHLSVLRGSNSANLISELIEMRNEVLQKLPLLFGWVGAKNRGIRKLMEGIGFQFKGFTMIKGESHGKVLEWHCYTVLQKEFYCLKNGDNLLRF